MQPEDPERFPSTIWARIRKRFGNGGAWADFLSRRYRQPIGAFIRSRGFGEHDAEDLTQEVFLEIAKPAFLKNLERVRGRFRSYLLGVVVHVIQRHLRKASRKKRGFLKKFLRISPEQGGEEALDLKHLEREKDERFDVLWLLHLLDLAMERLRAEDREGTAAFYHHALREHAIAGKPLKEIARDVGKTEQAIKNCIHRGKRRLRGILDDLIWEYSRDELDFHDEERHLMDLSRRVERAMRLVGE